MNSMLRVVFSFALAFAVFNTATGKQPDGANDWDFQGEYVGEISVDDGKTTFGYQIIAIGNGEFRLVGYTGGLPGEGWNGESPLRSETVGRRVEDEVVFADESGKKTIRNQTLVVSDLSGKPLGTCQKITRQSPTLNQPPPEGAIVLFEGTDADEWDNGRITDDGLLEQGTTSKRTFGDHHVHIEFRLPFQPEASGQGRGNSGIYLQGRYEVQMLDSFGLDGSHNECGGLYSVKACDVNMCFPPMTWQTYDIEFTAARYDGEKLIAAPRITVFHNGVKIHDDVELPAERNTTAARLAPGAEPGPIYLQDHGNPVRYRNIWVVETSE